MDILHRMIYELDGIHDDIVRLESLMNEEGTVPLSKKINGLKAVRNRVTELRRLCVFGSVKRCSIGPAESD